MATTATALTVGRLWDPQLLKGPFLAQEWREGGERGVIFILKLRGGVILNTFS